jgi:hypothetical protein
MLITVIRTYPAQIELIISLGWLSTFAERMALLKGAKRRWRAAYSGARSPKPPSCIPRNQGNVLISLANTTVSKV